MDYQFKYKPTLMQKLAVVKLKKNHCYGNWCGTGAGKTNSALIATRETNSKITVIICPNSVKQTWIDAINAIYPNNSNIVNYEKLSDIISFDRNLFNYIIINYEKFSINSTNLGKSMIDKLLSLNKIDFICIDEIQFTKSASDEEESHRRENIKYFRKEAALNNINPNINYENWILPSNIYVYGMTATPIINNINEAKSLIELITGKEHPEIENKINVANCYQVNKWLNIIGFRYCPNYGIDVIHKFINIEGDDIIIEKLKGIKTYLQIENILLDKKLNDINVINNLTSGTILYCQYKKHILNKVLDKLKDLHLTYTLYTGNENEIEREQNKIDFINKKYDILVATSPISTGVNGLQYVSNKIIILSYPWTGAEWDQLIGRINRQGSKFDKVEIIHPHVLINNEEWYDGRRWDIIQNKQTLSNVIVDGNLEKIYTINRNKIIKEILSNLSNIQDFSPERNNINDDIDDYTYQHSINVIEKIHQRANISKSITMHNYFQNNHEEWINYHKQREINKLKWDEDPVDIIGKYINARNDKHNTIADLGCGLAKLSKVVKPEYKVISVDHYSEDENVIQCDMADLSNYIHNNEIDITVFCLSLWGINYLDYIKEAYRITGKRGLLYICEPTTKFEQAKFINEIQQIGFDCIETIIKGDFTYYKFIKN